ncbi:MAG: transcriptional regulator [Caulobacteraceae bacterium]
MNSIDTNSLILYYQAKSGLGANTSATSGTGTNKKGPTPPWSATSTAPKMSALVQSVMAGHKFINTDTAKLDHPVGTPNATSDYKNLFGLYQAINALEGVAEQMSAKTVTDTQKLALNRRFDAGMKEVQAFLSSNPFKGLDLVQGVASDRMQSTVGTKAQNDTYTTGILFSGAANDEVPAFQGPSVFSATVKGLAGTSTTVDFDLSEMGSTPRTMGNVTNYLNSKMQAAGVVTRFVNQRTPGVPQTIQAGGKTVALGTTGPDQYALKINGISSEAMTFAAPAATPAVYVSQLSGKTTGDNPNPQAQLMKLDGGDQDAAKIVSKALGTEVNGIKASATAADGSLYVLAQLDNKTADGQPIKGDTDVALMKYDSAGQLLYTRTLGALDNADGLAISVSADGKQVAIGGSITGRLDVNDSSSVSTSGADSFVSVFNAAGEEQWTQRRGAVNSDDQVNAVSFGADGKVYLAGSTGSSMPGATSVGGRDAYLAAFSAVSTPVPGGTPTWKATPAFTTQFGSAGTDKATGLAIQGTTAYVSTLEDGHAMIRSYALQASGPPILSATRDLGDLMGGTITGVGIGAGGEVIVAGSTHNGALNAGTVTNPYGDGGEAFVARLSGDLQAAGSDRLTYYSGDGDTTASAMTVSGDSVYIAGRVAGAPNATSGDLAVQQGYAAQIDPATGAVTWSKRFDGADGQAAPTAISVDATGTSVLDRFGLPKGQISYGGQETVVAGTSLRAGDMFKIKGGNGLTATITIEASDTMSSLASKISRASGYAANASTLAVNGRTQLRIVPANANSQISIMAGPDGRNALQALGLAEGLIDKDATSFVTPKVGQAKSTGKIYGLNLPSTLSIDNGNSKQAQSILLTAVGTIQTIYRDMSSVVTPPSTSGSGGPVPAYLKNQIANYKDALARLTGYG